jgi:uncharacterized protein YndB with AHSA1/START domain
MPDILHRITIDAPVQQVRELIATTDGIAQWWTGRPLDGSAAVDAQFGLYFGDADRPAAVMKVITSTSDEIAWIVIDGPDAWIDTVITFTLGQRGEDGTTLLFTHAGWHEASEFMSGCSTNWGAYLTSLKGGVEGSGFAAFPASEISRWD